MAKTKKELKDLNEKMEKQIMQMLIQEEANHNISKQLRYWRSKAMSMEVNNHLNKKKKKFFYSETFYYQIIYLLGSNFGYKNAIRNRTDK